MNVSLTDGSRAHKEKPDEMIKSSFTPRQEPTFEYIHCWSENTLSQNKLCAKWSSRWTSAPRNLSPLPHAALSCVCFFSTMRLCSVCCCLCWNLAVPLVLDGAPAAAETSPVLSECAGKENFVWPLSPASAALFCVLSVAFASFLCVNAFSFCYPSRDSSVEPSNWGLFSSSAEKLSVRISHSISELDVSIVFCRQVIMKHRPLAALGFGRNPLVFPILFNWFVIFPRGWSKLSNG